MVSCGLGDISCSYSGLICVITWKHITFLRLSFAAAPLFSLCLKLLVLAPVSLRPPPLDKAQSALTGQLVHSVVIGQSLPMCVVWVGGVGESY